MIEHHDGRRFIAGSLKTGRYQSTGNLPGTYIGPTLTEQGIDVDEFIAENKTLIEHLRKGTN